MKKLVFGFFPVILLSFTASTAWSHGVVYEVKEDRTTIIKVEYDDGEPMSYAEVEIFSPGDEKIEYQNGRTDKNGCFAFLPNEVGEWKVKVNDGMGHGVVTKVTVKEGMRIDILHHGFSRWQKLVVGVSAIWCLTGLIFYFRARKIEKHLKED